MAGSHDHPVRETIHEKDYEHVVPPVAATTTTFVILCILAAVSLAIGFSNIGPYKVLASLLVAGVQASVLAYYFMDLRQGDQLTWLCVGASIFWTGLLFLFTLTDFITRHMTPM
jgi:caa(3)-type oxidase subunit IV